MGVLIAGVGAALVLRPDGPSLERDADLCLAEPAHRAALLVDFQKPLGTVRYGALLREVGEDLAAETELRVYALTSDADPPRRLLGRLCKPYGSADLAAAAAKEAASGRRDCDDPPARLPRRLREAATRFCALRRGLQQRVDGLGADREGAPVEPAHLSEAVDATVLELAGHPGERVLYVLSDMLQHSGWYSHLEREWNTWLYDDFASLRRLRGPPPEPDSLAGLRVRVLYVPRLGLTDRRLPQGVHRRFWRMYFAGADVEFREWTTAPAVAAAGLSTGGGRTALERGRRASERELARTARAADAVAEERRAASAAAAETGRQRARAPVAEPSPAIAAAEPPAAAVEPARRPEAPGAAAETTRAESPEAVVESARPPAAPVAAAETAGTETPEAAVESARRPAAPGAPGRLARRGAGARQTAEASACRVRLEPRFVERFSTERHVGDRRSNYGAAVIVVRFVVDARGATVDEETAFVPGRSRAEEAEHFDVLAADAVATVRGWAFAVEADGRGCEPQPGTATFTYRQRCVGRPVPACRTVRAEVRLLDAPSRNPGLFRRPDAA